jgi:hypothetical protein
LVTEERWCASRRHTLLQKIALALGERQLRLPPTYWAAGPRWASDYMFSIEPLSGNQDRPRMKSLLPYLF